MLALRAAPFASIFVYCSHIYVSSLSLLTRLEGSEEPMIHE